MQIKFIDVHVRHVISCIDDHVVTWQNAFWLLIKHCEPVSRWKDEVHFKVISSSFSFATSCAIQWLLHIFSACFSPNLSSSSLSCAILLHHSPHLCLSPIRLWYGQRDRYHLNRYLYFGRSALTELYVCEIWIRLRRNIQSNQYAHTRTRTNTATMSRTIGQRTIAVVVRTNFDKCWMNIYWIGQCAVVLWCCVVDGMLI